jgi:5-oxoprolinase (ATP-hydrolysing)
MAALTGAKHPARTFRTSTTSRRRSLPTKRGVAELRKMVTHFTILWWAYSAASSRKTPPKAAARDRLVKRSEFTYEMDQGTVIKVKITVDKRAREVRPLTLPARANSSQRTSMP